MFSSTIIYQIASSEKEIVEDTDGSLPPPPLLVARSIIPSTPICPVYAFEVTIWFDYYYAYLIRSLLAYYPWYLAIKMPCYTNFIKLLHCSKKN